MSTFNLLSEAIANAAMPPVPAVPLVLDFLCAADPMLQNFPSIAVPGLPCPSSSFIIAYWIATGRLFDRPLPPAMSFAAILNLLRLMPAVNIHFCAYNPAPVLAHSCFITAHGSPRPDGWMMVYIPPGVAGVAHLAMIQMRLDQKPPLPFMISHYGNTPLLTPQAYWHAPRSSSMYYKMKAEGRACLCSARCRHEIAFGGIQTLLTTSYSNDRDYQLEVVEYAPPYSRGKDRALHYVTVDGVVLSDRRAFLLDLESDLPSFEYVIGPLQIRMHDLRSLRRVPFHSIKAVGCSAVGALTATSVFMGISRAKSLTTLALGCFSTFMFMYVTARLPPWLYSFMTQTRYILSAEPAQLIRTWLPNSMRNLPFSRELHNKMAVNALDTSTARGYLRRACYEMQHEIPLQPLEVDAWLDEVVSSEASAPIPTLPLGVCYLCLRKKNLKRCLCVDCRKFPRWLPNPEPSGFVGMRPLFSSHPSIKLGVDFDPDVRICYKGKRITTTTEAMEIYKLEAPTLTCMGRLAGPMWLGQEATCYPRGVQTLLVAAAARIGVPCTNTPLPGYWDSLRSVYDHVVPIKIKLAPMSQQQVLSHQKDGSKREKLRLMYVDYNNGDMPLPAKFNQFGGFAKLEKHVRRQHDGETLKLKAKLAPRLINSPHPMVNAMMAPYTIPLTEWLHETFNHTTHLFYAGCSTPKEINSFLNNASKFCKYVLEDDVSMMDKSHTAGSQNFMFSVIQDLYETVYLLVLNRMLRQIRHVKIRQGAFRADLEDVNASGVPVTSFLNSLTTMFVRLNALVEAYFDVDISHAKYFYYLKIVMDSVYMAVAGDDGKLFCPEHIMGIKTFSADWMKRYIDAWSKAGFDVGPSKIRTFDPSNWRLSTFLAMRPYWNGSRYYYGVEISRRMRTMFWMIDSSCHPIAWGRGVATSLLKASPHVPIIKDVCIWYLDRTRGAVSDNEPPPISFTNIYSTIYGYQGEGDLCPRTISEFCSDYDITELDYQDFRNYLWTYTNVLVNLDHYVLRRIASYE